MTPAQSYACEIQSYLIRVVLGLDGDPVTRSQWTTRGISEPLDLVAISHAMKGKGKNELAFMVMDYNIIDLLKVLYHYDPEMNLYKGDFSAVSLYPAPEFVALRLFLIQRIHRKNPLELGAILENQRLLKDPDYTPDPRELEKAGLSKDERHFLVDVIAAQPRIYEYIQCPFLIKSLLEAGALKDEDFTRKKREQASYGSLNLRLISGNEAGEIKIVFLPSFIKEFTFGSGESELSPSGFRATEELSSLAKKLAARITEHTRSLLPGIIQERTKGNQIYISNNISFYLEDERPLAVYFGNVEETMAKVCPQADLAIILLDKNVRLSMHKPKESPLLPPYIFLDVMDIQYDQIAQELDTIVSLLACRLGIRGIPFEH